MNEPQPIRPPCDEDERRRKALETLRRSLKSVVKQVEELIEIENRQRDVA